ncbi:MAG TPA: hypothetical protein VIH57_15280 [Bacteroidales bacterium]
MKKKLTDLYNYLSGNSLEFFVFAMLFLAYILLLPRTGHGGDMWCWSQWTHHMFSNGLGNVYKSGTDYLPLYHYVLFLFAKFQGNLEHIDRNLFYLKAITLLFDFVAGYVLIKFLRTRYDRHQTILYSFLYFFNIGYFYNTVIWGQVDGIMASLVFLAFYCAYRKKVLISLIFILLSLNFKLQAIIFFPILGLMLLPAMTEQFSLRKLLVWIAMPVILQVLIIMPVLLAGDIAQLWRVVTGSVGKYPVVSANAYNFWSWVVKGDRMEISDSIRFLGITYKSWGLFMFCTSSFFALWPLFKSTISQLFCREKKFISTEKMLITATLIPMLFFFFNTQMHERYIHPAILFLAVYSLLSKKYLPYILGSVAYFLNLEAVLRYLQLKNYNTALFHPIFIAILFFVCMAYLFMQLYKNTSIPRQKIIETR